MEKSAERISAQEMIKANEAAEAAHRRQMEEQNRQYEQEIAVLRQNAQKLEDRLDGIESAIRNMKNADEGSGESFDIDSAIGGLKEDLEKRLDLSDEATHDVGVRIYRNVQASLMDEQKKQMDEISENLNKQLDSIRGEFSVLLRRLDTTRNQLEEEYRVSSSKRGKALVPLSVIILLITLSDLVINILRIIGLI